MLDASEIELNLIEAREKMSSISVTLVDLETDLLTNIFILLAPVVQRAGNFIHWISRYPAVQMDSNRRFWQVFHTIPYLNQTDTSSLCTGLSGNSCTLLSAA